jgi:hypothetical protein
VGGCSSRGLQEVNRFSAGFLIARWSLAASKQSTGLPVFAAGCVPSEVAFMASGFGMGKEKRIECGRFPEY